MILLLGGTTEAKQAASFLDAAGLAYVYSTRNKVSWQGKGEYRYGSLDQAELKAYCLSRQISHIIDAAHPFAAVLHQNVATLPLPIPVIRFEREFADRVSHPLVIYMGNYQSILNDISDKNYHSMLALTGVQSIPVLESFWKQYPCTLRILNRDSSIRLAAQYGFPQQHLLLGLPQDEAEEIQLFKALQPEVILSKESGSNGKLEEKINAAIHCNIPIYIIEKPTPGGSVPTVNTKDALLNWLR